MTNYDKEGQALNLPSIHKNVRKVDIRHNSELINYELEKSRAKEQYYSFGPTMSTLGALKGMSRNINPIDEE